MFAEKIVYTGYIALHIQKSNVCTMQRAAGGKFCVFASSFVVSALIVMKDLVSKNIRIFHVSRKKHWSVTYRITSPSGAPQGAPKGIHFLTAV